MDELREPALSVWLFGLLVLGCCMKVVILVISVRSCCCSNSRWCDRCSGGGSGVAVKDTVLEW